MLLNETTPFCIPFETAVVFKKNTFAGAALKKQQQTGPLANLKDSCLCFIPHLCGNIEVGEPFKEVRV